MKLSKTVFRGTNNLRTLALLAVFCAAFAWAWHQYHIPDYNPAPMNKFSSIFRTHCIGLYLINLPEELGNPWVSNAIFYYGLGKKFDTVEMEMPKPDGINRITFDRIVDARRTELATGTESSINVKLLVKEMLFDSELHGGGIMFRYLSSVSTLMSELHLIIRDRYIIIRSESFPSENAYLQDRNDLYTLADPRDAETRILAIAQKLRAITASNNTSTGFCMNNVLIEGTDLPYDDERAEFEFAVKAGEKSTLRLTIATNGRSGYPAETLHSRMSLIKLVVGPLNQEVSTRVIRRTRRSIEGDEFQEWAGEVYRKKEKISQFGFQLEKIETKKNFAPSFLRPGINITLAAGEFGSSNSASPYSLHQLEPAWDQWIASFRISPANGGKRE